MNEPEKIKCYELIPKVQLKYDSYIVKDDNTWVPILEKIEELLEEQFIADGSKWTDIGITIRCLEMTQAQLDELIDE